MEFTFSTIIITSKVFYDIKIDIQRNWGVTNSYIWNFTFR